VTDIEQRMWFEWAGAIAVVLVILLVLYVTN
jgi:hypothetical protein